VGCQRAGVGPGTPRCIGPAVGRLQPQGVDFTISRTAARFLRAGFPIRRTAKNRHIAAQSTSCCAPRTKMERGTFVAAPYRSYSTESRQGGQITGFEETDGMAAFTKSQLHPTRLNRPIIARFGAHAVDEFRRLADDSLSHHMCPNARQTLRGRQGLLNNGPHHYSRISFDRKKNTALRCRPRAPHPNYWPV